MAGRLEVKLEAVRRARERTAGGGSLAQIGRELGVRPDLLRKWERVQRERAGPERVSEVLSPAELERENRRLRRENETLRQERDFAKKAAAFFAKEFR